MCAFRPRTELSTHTVENQPLPRGDLPLWEADASLRAALDGAAPECGFAPESLAGVIGMADMVENGHRLATGPTPELHAFDTAGRRVDTVLYPPAYHAFLREGLGAGYAALPWTTAAPGGHPAHAAMVYLMTQVEPGVCCPMTMTYAAIPALAKGEGLAANLKTLALTRAYDETDEPLDQKHAATIGMAMTEKQGGSDVRANATRAEPADGAYRLTGHKWFCSAPMSDAFLTLAQRPEGLTCFLAPRWRPDGTRNAIDLIRLKNKLGNRANASAEIEYAGAYAEILGEPGDGIRTILEMVHHTRLDTAIAPAGLMRRALIEAKYWAENRSAFGKPLIAQPLMLSLLADLALEWRGALAIAMRTAWAFDRAGTDETERALSRLAVALAKYWNNKRCPPVVVEAMEILGGMGFIEDTPMPFLYREAPLNGIWEGSGNIIALDILRTLAKTPEAFEALRAEFEAARGASPAYDAALESAYADLKSATEPAARRIAERLALLLQAAILLKQPDPFPGEIFARTRLGGDWGHTLGTLPADADAGRLVAMI